jgi:trehalose-6-phosphate synthase
VNPWNIQDVADAFYEAVTMDAEERRERHEANFSYISKHTASHWGLSFIKVGFFSILSCLSKIT